MRFIRSTSFLPAAVLGDQADAFDAGLAARLGPHSNASTFTETPDQMIAAFAGQLKDAVDLDSVRDDLATVVEQALEPAHVSVWISQAAPPRAN